ncbi:MAG: HAMP domain-containing histidine kinase [Lachnospiraceae bacterium]|jgi:signal transduction histidine kinase|nr:HAMP domain-containing histidine kinase [Lachnospiraceae bacterium]
MDKAEFWQGFSHEMKTQLTVISTSILNASDQLDFAMDKEDMRASLVSAQQEVMRMSRMMDSALKFLTTDVNQYMTALDLGEILRTSAETYRPLAKRQGNVLLLEIPPDLPLVSGNEDMLLQTLSNLLANANRHTKAGEISLIAVAGEEYVSVTVRDNGAGIAPEILPQVFERGVSTAGSGRGLPICKIIVESLGGQIAVESEQGKGTAVTFTLPISIDGGEGYE